MRRKNKDFKRLMRYSLTMGGTSLIASGLPTIAKTPVQTVATTGSKFVAPMASATGAGMVVGTLRDLNPKKRKRRSK